MVKHVVLNNGFFNFQFKFYFMLRVLMTVSLFLNALVSQAQSDSAITPIAKTPPFSYKRDFKSLIDSTQDISSSLYYPVLLSRFLSNDSSLTNQEVLTLMIGFTENPKYKPLEDMEKEEEIYDLTKKGQFVDALAQSIPYLKSHPLSLLVLRETSYAYGRLSRYYEREQIFDTAIIFMDSSNYYMSLNDKIMEAMIYSGKGRTAEAPIFSLGLADGEHFTFNVGFKIEKKDTDWNRNGDFMEKITAADNLTAKDFYFVIQHAKQKIDDEKADELAAKKSKKEKKKEQEKKDQEKKKEGSAFKSEKPDKKSKGKRPAPVFDDRTSDSTLTQSPAPLSSDSTVHVQAVPSDSNSNSVPSTEKTNAPVIEAQPNTELKQEPNPEPKQEPKQEPAIQQQAGSADKPRM
jgi:hypothetical protein